MLRSPYTRPSILCAQYAHSSASVFFCFTASSAISQSFCSAANAYFSAYPFYLAASCTISRSSFSAAEAKYSARPFCLTASITISRSSFSEAEAKHSAYSSMSRKTLSSPQFCSEPRQHAGSRHKAVAAMTTTTQQLLTRRGKLYDVGDSVWRGFPGYWR